LCFWQRTTFGTWGSQVQILPLRPLFQHINKSQCQIWGTKPRSCSDAPTRAEGIKARTRSGGRRFGRTAECFLAQQQDERVESKRVQAFQDMSDEELERYVNGDKDLAS
jgi:hypothetical protein